MILKNVLQMAAGLILVVIIVALLVLVPVFGGNKPAVDGTQLPGGATQVLDGYVSVFILPAGDGVALIDCGNDPEGKAIKAALKGKKVTAIFLTHGHPDHTAACHQFPEATVYGFPADAKIAAAEEQAKGWIPKLFPLAPDKAIKIAHPLQDGEEVKLGDGTLKAYAVPGHTGGSAAYLMKGVLYLGDNVTARADGKTLKPAPRPFSDDPAENVASLAKLHARLLAEKADVALLAPSHSGTVEGLEALASAK